MSAGVNHSPSVSPTRLQAFDDAAARVAALSRVVHDELAGVLRRRDSAVLAVSGGRSPVPLFHALRRLPLDWSRVVVTLVDERLVAPDHADSNEALVREHLLRDAAAAARLVGLVDPQRLELEHCVQHANQGALLADVVLLGMGDDGHTASLFAGAGGIEQALDLRCAQRYVGVVPSTAPHARISLSLRALLEAPCLLLCIEGPAKRRVFDSAAGDTASRFPVARLLHHAGSPLRTFWSP